MKISPLYISSIFFLTASASMTSSAIADDYSDQEVNSYSQRSRSRTETVGNNETITVNGQKEKPVDSAGHGSNSVKEAAGKVLNLANQPGSKAEGNQMMEEEGIFYFKKTAE